MAFGREGEVGLQDGDPLPPSGLVRRQEAELGLDLVQVVLQVFPALLGPLAAEASPQGPDSLPLQLRVVLRRPLVHPGAGLPAERTLSFLAQGRRGPGLSCAR